MRRNIRRPARAALVFVGVGLVFGACSESTLAPTVSRARPGSPAFTIGATANVGPVQRTFASGGATQFCSGGTVTHGYTIPGSYTPLVGCGTAVDLQGGTPSPLDVYNPGWDVPVVGSHWIGPVISAGTSNEYKVNPGTYVFQTAFTIDAGVSSVVLNDTLLSDNAVAVYLNGHKVEQQVIADCVQPGPCNWQSTNKFIISDANQADFNIGGTNTLTVLLVDTPDGGNAGNNYACTYVPQTYGSHGFSKDGQVPTSPDHVVANWSLTMTNSPPSGCENPTGLDFSGSVSWVPPLNVCPANAIAGLTGSTLTNDLFLFTDGTLDANWQGATKGFAGNVTVADIAAKRTSGGVPYAGTISTDGSSLGAWNNIVTQNAGQAFSSLNQTAAFASKKAQLISAFGAINALPVTSGYANRSATSLDGLNTQNGIPETIVINITSGLQVSSQIDITGDAGDLFILRWDTDANFANGYQGQVKFQSGGGIVPHGGLTPANFINVAGDINSSGGGSNPPAPYPQGPGIVGGQNWNGGGFFTGYWLTTGAPTTLANGLWVGPTAPLSNGIFVGGWYSLTTKFSMTSGTSGIHVSCP